MLVIFYTSHKLHHTSHIPSLQMILFTKVKDETGDDSKLEETGGRHWGVSVMT